MKELFRKLEFRGLLKRVDELETALPGAPREPVERAELAWREATADELGSLPHEIALAAAGERTAVAAGEAEVTCWW